MPIRTPVVLLAAALVAASLPLTANPAEPGQVVTEQVPASVVMRLLHIDSPDQLMLGGVPEEFAERVSLPPEIRVVASVSHCCEEYSRHRVVADSSLTEAELRKALTDSLLASDWKRPPPQHPATRSGFASSRETGDDLTFCGADDAYLNASITESSEESTALELSLRTGYEYSPCSREAVERRYDGMFSWAQDLVPVLEPPEGTRSHGGGMGGSDDYAELSAMVDTDLSADVLVDHYASQLAAAGWQADRSVATTRAAVADVAVGTPEGESVIGFLMAHCGLQDGFRCEAKLRIYRER